MTQTAICANCGTLKHADKPCPQCGSTRNAGRATSFARRVHQTTAIAPAPSVLRLGKALKGRK